MDYTSLLSSLLSTGKLYKCIHMTHTTKMFSPINLSNSPQGISLCFRTIVLCVRTLCLFSFPTRFWLQSSGGGRRR
jgi:hypothetical protein